MKKLIKGYLHRYFGSITVTEAVLYNILYSQCFEFVLGKYMELAGLLIWIQMITNLYFYIAIPVFYYGIKLDGKMCVEDFKAFVKRAKVFVKNKLAKLLKRIGDKFYEASNKLNSKTE